MLPSPAPQLVALLGPTNTGKTHRAVERMLEHKSGMIGLPLRLLAREVYDRVSERVGELEVALVTGEERRVPPRPRYWVCTVESMPLSREVDFLAIDEVQLCAHPQRGHLFTERLLNARGSQETWLLGADTMRPAIEQLLPTASIRRHPRFSQLSAADAASLSSLPPRSAVIAFSVADVYQLADRLRGRRGGTAIVLGALSPRARNAQVAMYQAGEVDYLVATDAIGMGLNMDVDHVAFASLRKFDGRQARPLAPDELGQIAGRAGRHVKDGTFGTLAPVSLDPEVAFAVERHRYPPVSRLWWRNADLDVSSLAALLESLKARPKRPMLLLAASASDAAVLAILAGRADVAAQARGTEQVRLLWEVCQIPDYGKLLPEHHAGLCAEIFAQLCARGRLDDAFMQRRVRTLESADGDIDALLARLERIRTWSYVANRLGWLDDPKGWQERTMAAEDQLSSALHQRLIERFVDRLARHRRQKSREHRQPIPAQAQPASLAVAATSGPFAKLVALRATLPGAPEPPQPPASDDLADAIVSAPFERFEIDASGHIAIDGERIATLVRGADLLHPEVKLALPRVAGQGARQSILRRMRAHARDLVALSLRPLDPDAAPFSTAARGLLFQLGQALGTVTRRSAAAEIAQLTPADRAHLRDAAVQLGRRMIYAAPLLDAAAVRRRIALCSAFWAGAVGRRPAIDIEPGTVAAPRVPAASSGAIFQACGYAELGPLALRADAVERLVAELDRLGADGPFACPDELCATLGCSREAIEGAILALGGAQTERGLVWRTKAKRGEPRRARRA